MLSPNSKNGSTIVNKVLLGLRITAAICNIGVMYSYFDWVQVEE